jgi:hypothetical protein
MTHLRLMRRGGLHLLVVTLLATLVVVLGASPAIADTRCTGAIWLSRASDQGTTIGITFRSGGSDTVDPGLGAVGNERNPIVRFTIRPNQVGLVDYYDLRTGAHLAYHVVLPGTYEKNPCHRAVVSAHWR